FGRRWRGPVRGLGPWPLPAPAVAPVCYHHAAAPSRPGRSPAQRARARGGGARGGLAVAFGGGHAGVGSRGGRLGGQPTAATLPPAGNPPPSPRPAPSRPPPPSPLPPPSALPPPPPP